MYRVPLWTSRTMPVSAARQIEMKIQFNAHGLLPE
jgi:hypothetical protein